MKIRILFALGMFTALALVASCGSDDDVTGPEPEVLERPPVPEPTYYAGPVPERSIELVMATVELSEFVAAADSIWIPSCGHVELPCMWYGTTENGRRIGLVRGDTTVTRFDSLATEIIDSWGHVSPMWASPLSSRPYLQHVRYWVRLGDPERYSGSTSVSVTRSTTRGVERTQAQEFGMSIGMEASVSGGLFVEFSMTLRTEFSYSSSTAFSVSEEETVEESFNITCPDNRNIVYCVWQLVDEFRIIGADGEPFTDPVYQFTAGSLGAVYPTDFVPMTTYFDNH